MNAIVPVQNTNGGARKHFDIILDKAPSAFTETWADRKARIAKARAEREAAARQGVIAPPRVRPRITAAGQPVDTAFVARAKRLWDRGLYVKRIALEMGCSTVLIFKLRREHGWAVRMPGKKAPRGLELFSLKLDPSLAAAMDAKILGTYRNRAEYLRTLIRRDLGL